MIPVQAYLNYAMRFILVKQSLYMSFLLDKKTFLFG